MDQREFVMSKIIIAQASRDDKYLLRLHLQVYIKLDAQSKFEVMIAICSDDLTFLRRLASLQVLVLEK